MKIELKNIKVNMSFSEETICFTADLYMDGKKVGYCKNNGCGGDTDIHGIEKLYSDDIKKMEEYCKTLPKVKIGLHEYEQSLEGVIGDIIDNYVNEREKKKFQKKMEKDMLKWLILSKGDPNRYETVGWKKFTIQQMIEHPYGQLSLKKTIQNMKDKGYTILNTNIPQEFM